MKRAYVFSAFSAVVGSFVLMAACSSGDDSTGPQADSGATPIDSGSAGETSMGMDSGTMGSETAGESGPPTCPMMTATGKLADLLDPSKPTKIAPATGIKLTGVVATSIKFRSGGSPKVGKKCHYSVFVADPNATFLPYSGIEIESDTSVVVADPAGGKPKCPADDLIPDVKPGDTLDVTGVYSEFGPTAMVCAGAAPAVPPPTPGKAAQIYKLCAIAKTGTAPVPAPAVVTPAQIGDGSTELAKWAGGLVQITGVTASDAADKFGSFPITGSKLHVSDKIWFRGKSPTVAKDQAFSSITGLSYLDFCTWSLAPSKCEDMVATSGSVCPAAMMGDAGPETGGPETGGSETGGSDTGAEAGGTETGTETGIDTGTDGASAG